MYFGSSTYFVVDSCCFSCFQLAYSHVQKSMVTAKLWKDGAFCFRGFPFGPSFHLLCMYFLKTTGCCKPAHPQKAPQQRGESALSPVRRPAPCRWLRASAFKDQRPCRQGTDPFVAVEAPHRNGSCRRLSSNNFVTSRFLLLVVVASNQIAMASDLVTSCY